MSYLATFSLIIISTLLITTRAANFQIRNNCPYVVWAAAYPGGGRRLNPSESWSLDVPPGTQFARIWGRTKCNDDASVCETGDCGRLDCTGYGKTPNTVAEFALKQFNNYDYYDISLIDGFNIPMEFGPTNNVKENCIPSSCTADIIGQCPDQLKFPGGCNNPCTVFKTNEYCCTEKGPCNPTGYSNFFKERCPTSLSYKADQTGNRSCPDGTNYQVVFCP